MININNVMGQVSAVYAYNKYNSKFKDRCIKYYSNDLILNCTVINTNIWQNSV